MPFFENVYLILGFYAKDRQNEDIVGGSESKIDRYKLGGLENQFNFRFNLLNLSF